jgi:hypothetical protein
VYDRHGRRAETGDIDVLVLAALRVASRPFGVTEGEVEERPGGRGPSARSSPTPRPPGPPVDLGKTRIDRIKDRGHTGPDGIT